MGIPVLAIVLRLRDNTYLSSTVIFDLWAWLKRGERAVRGFRGTDKSVAEKAMESEAERPDQDQG